MIKYLLAAAFALFVVLSIAATIGIADFIDDLQLSDVLRYVAVLAPTIVLGYFTFHAFKPKQAAPEPLIPKPLTPKSSAPAKPATQKPISIDQMRAIILAERAKKDVHHQTMFRAEFEPALARLHKLVPAACARLAATDVETALNDIFDAMLEVKFPNPRDEALAWRDLGEVSLGVERTLAETVFEFAVKELPTDFWSQDGMLRAYTELEYWELADAASAVALATAENWRQSLIAAIDEVLLSLRSNRLDSAASAIAGIEEILGQPGLNAPELLVETANMFVQGMALHGRSAGQPRRSAEDSCRRFFNDSKSWIRQRHTR
jgi:hypothetical protein